MIKNWKFITLFTLFLTLVTIAYQFGIDMYYKKNPSSAFSSLVGVQVPPKIHIIKYSNKTDDNLLHTTHLWLLQGDIEALRKIIVADGFERSDEDARWILPEIADQFGLKLTPTDLAEGYESNHAHNRWFLILKEQQLAIYVL